ncbi:MAG: hypothetical protein MnENMB40S_07180 [Rhizobiaceae bacterium MnEN-MB40S]|nr:MAG: hypothetical protein MnENMB40S_07180 [Rhizobiaceae bacterium MnEN-MB40S]
MMTTDNRIINFYSRFLNRNSVVAPHEAFPELGTVANPAIHYDGNDAFLCYEASAQAGRGNVVLKFGDVIDFHLTPLNIHGLHKCRYPIEAWSFNEILGSREADPWKVLGARFWLISFNDVTIEILFQTVSIMKHDTEGPSPGATLIDALSLIKQ